MSLINTHNPNTAQWLHETLDALDESLSTLFEERDTLPAPRRRALDCVHRALSIERQSLLKRLLCPRPPVTAARTPHQ